MDPGLHHRRDRSMAKVMEPRPRHPHPELLPTIGESATRQLVEHKIAGRRVQLSDLLTADLLAVGETLE